MNMFFKNNSVKVHGLILEQIKDVEGCLADFASFIKGAVNPQTDMGTLRSLAQGVHHMENAADRSLRNMIDSLNGSFLPATRSELIDIAASCDKIANKCQHAAQMIVFQRFHFPAQYAGDILKIIALTQQEFSLLMESIKLLFTKFGDFLEDHAILDKIRECETKVDILEERLYESIYALGLGLAERMQIAQLLELICDPSDIIENVADLVQIMLITRKV